MSRFSTATHAKKLVLNVKPSKDAGTQMFRVYMGGSINGDPTKWLAYKGTSHRSKWMMTGGTRLDWKPPLVEMSNLQDPLRLHCFAHWRYAPTNPTLGHPDVCTWEEMFQTEGNKDETCWTFLYIPHRMLLLNRLEHMIEHLLLDNFLQSLRALSAIQQVAARSEGPDESIWMFPPSPPAIRWKFQYYTNHQSHSLRLSGHSCFPHGQTSADSITDWRSWKFLPEMGETKWEALAISSGVRSYLHETITSHGGSNWSEKKS